MNLIELIGRGHGGRDPYNLLVFSNHPQHYGEDDRTAPGSQVFGLISTNPRVPVHHPQALLDLIHAANLYGNTAPRLTDNNCTQAAWRNCSNCAPRSSFTIGRT